MSALLTAQTGLLFTDADTGALRLRRYRLEVATGPDAGAGAELDGGTFLIGTHLNNDLRLTDATVSRYHLELQLRSDGLKITDLDSSNGTFQGPTRVGSIVVRGPARLRLGGATELSLVPIEDPIEVPPYEGERFGRAVGGARPMRELFALLSQVAQTDATVLLEGETGTGKELLAEALHERSGKRAGPFVVVDCGAIPRDLIGSELFGHVRGAFTGAVSDKRGLLQEADGGTLFLDEIGELALDLQPQLLRVLEKREVRRLGETRARRVDLRVIAATHRDLKQMVADGRFREDLYFRLAVVRAQVPPLRRRKEDLALLVRHIVADLGRGDWPLSDEGLAKLRGYDWPGNVRELRNVVERGLWLTPDDLPVPEAPVAAPGSGGGGAPPVPSDVLELPFKEAKGMLVEAFEREYLAHLLERNHGNISRAAQEAGIDRNYIHRLVKKYGLPVDRG